ncbi:MAG TPA: VOC family protein [Acidimicrobiales bacterium]|nr:VOC family protein [Acidimicrobiales bacterium]
MTGTRLHHAAMVVRDVDASLRFYRDGIGLEVLMDHVFHGDWPTLFTVGSTALRSVFLGDPAHPDAGVVELVAFDADRPTAPAPTPAALAAGFFLLSFNVDVESVLSRLGALGYGPARRIEQPAPRGPVAMATVLDPDGVLIELIGVADMRVDGAAQ